MLRNKEEEVSYFKEYLKAAKSDLERELQINSAIKDKKVKSKIYYSNGKFKKKKLHLINFNQTDF